jgi:hypothetical protein
MDSRFRGNDGFGGYSRFPEVPGRRSAEAIPAFAGMTMGADATFVGMTILEGLAGLRSCEQKHRAQGALLHVRVALGAADRSVLGRIARLQILQ